MEIIENIPTMIPTIVKVERNLLARKADIATFAVSMINIIIVPQEYYSYRNASTGSILDAVYAGANPEITPVITEITIARITASN